MRDLESRIRAVVKRRTPKGWRVKERANYAIDGKGWACRGGKKVIECAPLVDRQSLAVFLHEVGHVVLGHCDDPSVPEWLAEYEADRFAIKTMAEEGIACPRVFESESRYSIACLIEKAQAKDSDTEIDEPVLQWAYQEHWRKAA